MLAARDLLYEGLDRLKIPYFRSQANFVLFQAGARAIEVRDKLRDMGVLVRDRSYELARLRPGDGGHARAGSPLSRRAGGDLVMPEPLLVFDMDGVLVDVTESYRETIRQTVQHFTGREIGNERIQDLKNAGGWNNDWALAHRIIAGSWRSPSTMRRWSRSSSRSSWATGDDGLMLREKWVAAAGTAGGSEPPLPAGCLHRAAASRKRK